MRAGKIKRCLLMGDIDEIFLFQSTSFYLFNVVFTKSSRVITNNFSAVTQKSVVEKISFLKSDMDIFGMYIVPKVQ